MTEPVAAPRERASFAEDFLDVLYAPSAVFARRENASPWPVVLVITGLFAILTYVSFQLLGPMWEAEMDRMIAQQLERNPQIQPAALEATRSFSRIMMQVGGIVAVPLSVLVLGLLLWVAGKLVDAEQRLSAAFLVVAFSWMPRIIETILFSLQGVLLDPSDFRSRFAASLGPARFADPDTTSPLVLGILERLSPFVIWSYVILAIGLSVTGRIPRSKAAVAVVLLWMLASVPTLLQGMQ